MTNRKAWEMLFKESKMNGWTRKMLLLIALGVGVVLGVAIRHYTNFTAYSLEGRAAMENVKSIPSIVERLGVLESSFDSLKTEVRAYVEKYP